MIHASLTAIALVVAFDPNAAFDPHTTALQTALFDPIAPAPALQVSERSVPTREAAPGHTTFATPALEVDLTRSATPVQAPERGEPAPRPRAELVQVQAQTQPAEQVRPAGETPPRQQETPVPVKDYSVDPAEWPAIIAQIDESLEQAKTAQGRFRQSSSGGQIEGSFAISRPGRMRFEYDPPSPLLVVSDGTTVALSDSELETVDRVPLRSTPLGFVLESSFRVDESVTVQRIIRDDSRIAVTLLDASGEIDGEITLLFTEVDMNLLGWLAVDSQQQITSVDLLDVTLNTRVDPKLFRLDEPEDEEDER